MTLKCASREFNMVHAAQIENDFPIPTGLQSFAQDEDRRRLTPSAVKAVLRLVAAWGGSNADGAALLGVSESSWDRMKAGRWDGTLSQDRSIVFPAALADRDDAPSIKAAATAA